MCDKVKDDPREILAILNSLGVVGVTAEELKAFMKELKLFRKLKERERQQWKERVRAKILTKTRHSLLETPVSSHYYQNQDILKEIPKEYIDTRNQMTMTERQEQRPVVKNRAAAKESPKKNFTSGRLCNRFSTVTISPKSSKLNSKDLQNLDYIPVKEKSKNQLSKKLVSQRPFSAPDLAVEKISRPCRRARSVTCSARQDKDEFREIQRSKSFIRPKTPGTLQAQKSSNKLINDPVSLYEKYSFYWNKFPLPGENPHTKLRWTVREKMLGSSVDPKPVVPLKKSNSFGKSRKRA